MPVVFIFLGSVIAATVAAVVASTVDWLLLLLLLSSVYYCRFHPHSRWWKLACIIRLTTKIIWPVITNNNNSLYDEHLHTTTALNFIKFRIANSFFCIYAYLCVCAYMIYYYTHIFDINFGVNLFLFGKKFLKYAKNSSIPALNSVAHVREATELQHQRYRLTLVFSFCFSLIKFIIVRFFLALK